MISSNLLFKVKVGLVLVIGNVILLGGSSSSLKRRDARGQEIDITVLRHTIEVKNCDLVVTFSSISGS